MRAFDPLPSSLFDVGPCGDGRHGRPAGGRGRPDHSYCGGLPERLSGQPYLFEFGNGMSFRVSSKRYYLPDGSPFEGVGLKPDVEVVPSLEDSKAGRDPVLAKALQLASQN